MKQLRIALLILACAFAFASVGNAQDAPAKPKPRKEKQVEVTVYVTKTGAKYHRADCSYLRRSKIPMKLSEAKAGGYTPCSRCSPPR